MQTPTMQEIFKEMDELFPLDPPFTQTLPDSSSHHLAIQQFNTLLAQLCQWSLKSAPLWAPKSAPL